MRRQQENRRAQWLREYERLLIANQPQLAGHIDWETATFLFNKGLTPELASVETLSKIWGK